MTADEWADDLILHWPRWERDAGEVAQIEQSTEAGDAVMRALVAEAVRQIRADAASEESS